MSDPAATGPATTDGPIDGFSPEELRRFYRSLLLPRMIEEKMLVLLRQGRLSKWFSGIGQEAIATGVVTALEADDYVLPMHRNLGVFTGRDLDLPRLFRQLLGREGGFTKGRDRTFHFGTLDKGIVGMISHLGAMLPVACGLALAAQLKGDRRVAAAFTGDGATSEGDFHEALNLAAVWKLPVLFVIENNHWGLSTPAHEQYACRNLADRGLGYGMPGVVVDGNDLLSVHRAVRRAAERARRGDGPTLLEFKTFRMRGHEEASGTDYVPKEQVEEWAKKDPVKRYEAFLVEKGLFTEADFVDDPRRLQGPDRRAGRRGAPRARAALDGRGEAGRRLRAEPARPEGAVPRGRGGGPGAAVRGRHQRRPAHGDAPGRPRRPPRPGHRRVRRRLQGDGGLRRGVRQGPRAQHADHRVGRRRLRAGPRPRRPRPHGRDAVRGLHHLRLQPDRQQPRQDPLALGSAGARRDPRPVGGGTGAGPFHSQNVESWFTAVAGIKVVAPATPYDAKGLLISAFEDGNPVLYLEHKFLYRSARGRVPAGHYSIPIGQARVAREGRDATLVTYGVGVSWALEAAAELAG